MEVPFEVVSEQLGHSPIRVTNDVYGHLLASSELEAAVAMIRASWSAETEDSEGRLQVWLQMPTTKSRTEP